MQSPDISVEFDTEQQWLSHVKVGQRFDIQLLDHLKTRCTAELIGYKPGRYLFFKPDDSVPERFFQNGLILVCRFLLEETIGECLAFKSELLQLIRLPDRLIAISFPDAVQRRGLRLEKRSSLFLPATVRLNMEVLQNARSFNGHLVDVSNSGCRFLFEAEYKANKVQLAPVLLRVENPKLGDPIAISGEVRNSRVDERGLSIGIQFNEAQYRLEQLIQQAF